MAAKGITYLGTKIYQRIGDVKNSRKNKPRCEKFTWMEINWSYWGLKSDIFGRIILQGVRSERIKEYLYQLQIRTKGQISKQYISQELNQLSDCRR